MGGQRLLVVPPELAYGARGKPPLVPPNATVEFAVSLLSVRRAGTNPNSVINIVRGGVHLGWVVLVEQGCCERLRATAGRHRGVWRCCAIGAERAVTRGNSCTAMVSTLISDRPLVPCLLLDLCVVAWDKQGAQVY